MAKVFFAMNRANKTAEMLCQKTFDCIEYVRACAHVGFQMTDGQVADAFGHAESESDFLTRAAHSGFTVLK